MKPTNIKIYKNDVLLYDCTLCENPEGRIGWYNFVDDTFHDDTENLLNLRFKSTVGTQWIDTGVVPVIVHCRDCVSKKELPDGRLFCTNPAGINRIVTEDEFCCKGERK